MGAMLLAAPPTIREHNLHLKESNPLQSTGDGKQQWIDRFSHKYTGNLKPGLFFKYPNIYTQIYF